MVETSMNLFDLGVLIIIGLSALLSFFRGFAREVLSLGAWLLAGVVTLYTFPTVAGWIEPQVKNAAIASGLASMGVFFVSLIFLSIFTGTLVKFIKPGSEVGMLDNLVGLVFGAARGALVVSIAYFIMTLVMVEKDYPEWVKRAESRPYVERAAGWVAAAAPEYLDVAKPGHKAKVVKTNVSEDMKDTLDDIRDKTPSFDELQRRVRDENKRD